MTKSKIKKALTDINNSHREAVVQLILAVGNEVISKNPEIKTIAFGASYEYNDEGYDYNYRISADDIEINGYNMWQLDDEDDEDDDFCKKNVNIDSLDKFSELVESIEETFSPFEGEIHGVFGKNFKLVISKNAVKIEEDAYDY
jgi:hypothetical protein